LADDDPWASYARTVVVVTRPGETNLVVRPAPPEETGRWPWASDAAWHILTAWDPGATRPSEEENRRGQAELEAQLRALGPAETWSVVGIDPVTTHREEGVAVCGIGIDAALRLAARFGQDAIFEWTPAGWAIAACRDERRAVFGWSLGPV
jgi:hypothetical protein